jgi:hypothetical protein
LESSHTLFHHHEIVPQAFPSVLEACYAVTRLRERPTSTLSASISIF